MAQIIETQAMLPLFLHISTSPGPGLNILGVSFGKDDSIFSLSPDVPVVSAEPQLSETQPPELQLPMQSVAGPGHLSNTMEFNQPDEAANCPEHQWTAYLLSQDPQMIYIENFLTEEERLHLISVSEPNYNPAFVYNDREQSSKTDLEFRRSETAAVERSPLVKCIERRVQSVQPWRNMALEPFTVQRYQKDGYFTHHYDAMREPPFPNRRTTLNVWLDGNCTGGGTHFPLIPRWEDPALCEYVDCETADNGTVFKPIAGNAVFWENIRHDGRVYEEILHAGLPVVEGVKIGLNIWSWEFPAEDPRGQTVLSS